MVGRACQQRAERLIAIQIGIREFVRPIQAGRCELKRERTFAGSRNENAAEVRGVVISFKKIGSTYFDTDFLNMRSIFSFVASQQAWLA